MADAVKNLGAIFGPLKNLRQEVGGLEFDLRNLRSERETVAAQPLPTSEVLQALLAHIEGRRALLNRAVADGLMRRARSADFDVGYVVKGLLEDLHAGGGLDTALRADLLKKALTDAFSAMDAETWKPGLGLAERARKLEQIDQSIARIETRLAEISAAANEANLSL